MVKCKECGNDCSPRAERCPKCGNKIYTYKVTKFFIVWLTIIIPLFLFAIILPPPLNLPFLIILVGVILIGGSILWLAAGGN